jgi:uncharacterized C2H2 Zn-finger protein
MLFMRGLKAKDLVAIVDFIYLGEANVYQEDLDSFLALADELELKGLAGSQYSTQDNIKEEPKVITPAPNRKRQERKTIDLQVEEHSIVSEDWTEKYDSSVDNMSIMPVEDRQLVLNTGMEDLKDRINSMIERTGEGVYSCTVCGKINRSKKDLGRHVETHIEGVSYPCNLCEKISRSSMGLINHVSRHHRK